MTDVSIKIIFFGSTSDSVLVLEKLSTSHFPLLTPLILAVVTQPALPVGRKQVLTSTPVEVWAKTRGVTVISFPSDRQKPWLFANERQVVDALQPMKADLLVSASYGQKIPWETIVKARYGGLNVHPSLLPRWRGADPVPWAILSADHQTGVTVGTLSETFDEGQIIAQKKVPIVDTDTSDALRTKLFSIGADLLMESLNSVIASAAKQSHTDVRSPRPAERGLAMTHNPYARRLTRDDGFEAWDTIQKAFDDPEEAKRIDRKFRAFHPWPGLWTTIQGKRVKILRLSLIAYRLSLETVQLEGKKPVSWKQFRGAYLPS